MDLLGISGGMTMTMEWTPDKYYLMKEWGINPYDPTDTLAGLEKLPLREVGRLWNTLLTIGFMKSGGGTITGIRQIMGLIYFEDSEKWEDYNVMTQWAKSYDLPSKIMNWSTSNFVTMMRKEGFITFAIKYV